MEIGPKADLGGSNSGDNPRGLYERPVYSPFGEHYSLGGILSREKRRRETIKR